MGFEHAIYLEMNKKYATSLKWIGGASLVLIQSTFLSAATEPVCPPSTFSSLSSLSLLVFENLRPRPLHDHWRGCATWCFGYFHLLWQVELLWWRQLAFGSISLCLSTVRRRSLQNGPVADFWILVRSRSWYSRSRWIRRFFHECSSDTHILWTFTPRIVFRGRVLVNKRRGAPTSWSRKRIIGDERGG